jgi:hypothetical protein
MSLSYYWYCKYKYSSRFVNGEYILKEIYKRYTGTVPDWVELRAEDGAELQESETAEAQAYNILENIVAGIIDFIRKKWGKIRVLGLVLITKRR